MSNLISIYIPPDKLTTCLESSEQHGKTLYKQNDNYRVIANCLEHPEFRKLFDKHFDTWDNIRTIVMFMKLYDEIGKASPIELNGYQKLSIMDNIMKDGKFRREICRQATDWMKLKKRKIKIEDSPKKIFEYTPCLKFPTDMAKE